MAKHARPRQDPRARRKDPTAVDIHVGRRVRLRRTLMGLSQERLADAMGLSFQQVQKYERGTNRICASRLYDLSRILEVSLDYFFDELPDDDGNRCPETAEPRGVPERTTKRETLELVRTYYRIADPRLRRSLFETTKAIATAKSRKP